MPSVDTPAAALGDEGAQCSANADPSAYPLASLEVPHQTAPCAAGNEEDRSVEGHVEVETKGEAEEGKGSGETLQVVEAATGTLEDAQRLFDEGRQFLRSQEYAEAAEHLSRSLEIRARHYGDLAIECAFTYYKYGCALLYKAQSEADPLCEVKEIDEEDAPSNTTEEAGDSTKETTQEEDLEEEEESDLDMAWKMLDIARIIYEKQQSHSIEEVDVITALADVSLEREDFEMCFRDYTKALEIMQGLVEPDHRGIAELCFKLSLAHQLGYKPKEALSYCQKAVSICETRLGRLRSEAVLCNGNGKSVVEDHADEKSHKETLEESVHDTIPTEAEKHCREKEKDEISEIEQLLEDLKEKVIELEGMASRPSLLESLKETNPEAVNSIKQVFSATAQFASLQGQNSSGTETTHNGFESSTSSSAPVTHLGVVGRGVKRAAPICVTSAVCEENGEENPPKKRTLDDMLTKGASGETQIGFEKDAQSN